MRATTRSALLCAGLLLAAAGCGGGEEVGRVSGRVTLDGKPLANATVEFHPKDGGRQSVGVTDSSGEYTLKYTTDLDGAKVGTHLVRVRTGAMEDEKLSAPERVPAKYNVQSQLFKEVEPGSNSIDLELKTDGPVVQPDARPKRERYVPTGC